MYKTIKIVNEKMQLKTTNNWSSLHWDSRPEEPREVAREIWGERPDDFVFMCKRLEKGKKQWALETISEFAPQKHLFE